MPRLLLGPLRAMCKTHSLTKYPKTDARGTSGGKQPTYPETGATALRGWVQPASTSDQVEAYQRGYNITNTIYFSSDPSLGDEDGLLWGAKWLIVRGVALDVSGLGKMYRVFAEELGHRQQDSP